MPIRSRADIYGHGIHPLLFSLLRLYNVRYNIFICQLTLELESLMLKLIDGHVVQQFPKRDILGLVVG